VFPEGGIDRQCNENDILLDFQWVVGLHFCAGEVIRAAHFPDTLPKIPDF